MGQVLNVMNLKERPVVHFEGSRLIAAFADTVGLLANPSSDFWITQEGLTSG